MKYIKLFEDYSPINEGKREVNKVVTAWKKLGETDLNKIAKIYSEAMTDANFHQETVTSKAIGAASKGGNVGDAGQKIAGAADWTGSVIASGTVEYLKTIGETSTADKLQKTVNKWTSPNGMNTLVESVNEKYDGNLADFKYDLEMALEDAGLPATSIKKVSKMGKRFEVRMASYMSQRGTWEKLGNAIGATLVDFKHRGSGSINVGIYESVNEAASRTAMEIGGLTGMNKDAVQRFVDTHNLDIEKVFQFVKKGKLSDRMDFTTAVAGKPGNPIQKKMIKIFSESGVNEINEEVKIDTDLAQITLDYLVQTGKKYDQTLYLSLHDRDQIKDKYGKLPRGFAGPNSYMMSGSILSPLAGDDVYVDGDELVKGDKTVMRLKKGTTFADVAKALKIETL